MSFSVRHALAAATAVLAVAATTLSAPAAHAADDLDGSDGRLELLTTPLPTMTAGQHGWIAGTYVADKDLCDVRITGTAPGVSISYPENTATHSSFYREAWLPDGGLDFSALDVTVAPGVTAPVTVTLTASYIKTASGKASDPDSCRGARKTQTLTATLPIDPAKAAAFTVLTSAVTVDRATPSWIRLVVRGDRPTSDPLRATLTPAAGLTVTYPGDGSSSGLQNDASPAVGVEDYLAFRLDASGAKAGTYTVPVTLTSGVVTTTVSVKVVVTQHGKAKATATSARPAAPRGAAATAAYVRLGAARLCVVGRNVYPTPAALQSAYRTAEKASGLSASQITAFDRRANSDAALRKAVLARYRTTCR